MVEVISVAVDAETYALWRSISAGRGEKPRIFSEALKLWFSQNADRKLLLFFSEPRTNEEIKMNLTGNEIERAQKMRDEGKLVKTEDGRIVVAKK